MRKICILAILLLGMMVGGGATLQAHPLDSRAVETVANFDASQLETPENIAIGVDGSMFVSLALTGEIRKLAPDGTQTTYARLPIGQPLTFCGPFFNAVTGITLDSQGALYVSVVACDPANRGVWRILSDGTQQRLATLPLESLPNGIVLHLGFVERLQRRQRRFSVTLRVLHPRQCQIAAQDRVGVVYQPAMRQRHAGRQIAVGVVELVPLAQQIAHAEVVGQATDNCLQRILVGDEPLDLGIRGGCRP
jgi:hypothetical protein